MPVEGVGSWVSLPVLSLELVDAVSVELSCCELWAEATALTRIAAMAKTLAPSNTRLKGEACFVCSL